MAHAQNSPRGLFAKQSIHVGSSEFTFNSTALLLSKGVRLNGQANGLLTSNSTGVNFPGAIFVSGQATRGKVTANSTAVLLPTPVRIGSLASNISSNSTGILIGSRYISTNTTGNSTT